MGASEARLPPYLAGGENISTVEVESCIFSHPAILEASVVARPHEKWGEVPCAFVVLQDGQKWGDGDATEAHVIQFCRDNIGKKPLVTVSVVRV